MTDAEREIKVANAGLADVEQTWEDTLTVAGNCHRHYEAAPEFVKRQINQGFSRKLLIHQDGTVQRAELTEPFAQLLAPNWHAAARDAQTPEHRAASRTPDEMPPPAPGRPGTARRAGRRRRWWDIEKPRQ